MTTPTLVKGFQHIIHDSQIAFRQLLKAMSEPGSLVSVSSPEPIDHLNASTFAICQAMLDQQTPLWLSPHFHTTNIKHNLHFHTGVSIIDESQQALFALLCPGDLDSFADLSQHFSQGTNEYPETGCTLIVQVSSIKDDLSDEGNLRLTGPGIETAKFVSISDLPLALLDYLSNQTGERNASFPLGLDFIFVDQTHLVCLPRTTQVEVL
ncbi:phosphonate C-P lyase system protein PhnH [Marinomonas spartinae]|uniref:phosphonate C-P lyase system protein PhnH n=1 Tax=Marinomonas spartinae TaxID=1792290 RepID=UPI0018F266CF|nr:phosphonate C-P lyase system protein PhnH [Marinomonas spartinae]MBJ7554101.1 phosphonate C-P lyase system protein PhnH [Marinomonas spartinae]